MKKIGSLKLGLSFAGCFLGAGYVSGQELWQFFGSFGTFVDVTANGADKFLFHDV